MTPGTSDKPHYRTQGILGYATLATVLLVVLANGGNSPLVWSLMSVVIWVLLVFQFLICSRHDVPLSVQTLVVPGLCFLGAVAWAWVQTTGLGGASLAHPVWSHVPEAEPRISADPGQGRHVVMRLLCYAAVFVIVVWTCSEDRRASRCLKVIAVFTTLIAGYGIAAYASGSNVFLGESAGSTYVTATFINRNSFGTYAVFGVLANLAALLSASSKQSDDLKGRLEGFFSSTWIYALGILLGVGAVSLTQSRAAAVAGLIGLVVLLLSWRRRSSKAWDYSGLALTAAIVLFIALTSATNQIERLLATSEEELRFLVYPAVVQSIADRPVLGHGLGSFQDVFRAYVPVEASNLEWQRAHNTYLEVVFGLGIPAAMLFFLSLGLIVARIVRGARKRRMSRAPVCFALASVAAAGFHSLFDFSLQMPANGALFAVVLGLGYAQSFSYSEHRRHLKRQRVRETA